MTLDKKPILSVNNLQVEFPTRKGNLVAVNDISFEVNEGEVLGAVSYTHLTLPPTPYV